MLDNICSEYESVVRELWNMGKQVVWFFWLQKLNFYQWAVLMNLGKKRQSARSNSL